MSDEDEYDDDIDWEEAIIAADAADSARRPENAANIEGHNDRDADTQVAVAELLLLYDLLEREEASISAVGDIEDTLAMAAVQAAKVTGKSLFDQFRRKRGFLSVTDLTAPGGWCEVQYAYSLLGRRELKPEQRPDRIVTAAGNEIKVDKKIAVAHEKMLEKGRQVHKVLEREVHPEQVYIKTHTKADAWGLRIFNQIVSLATLKDAGKAREIPVFGFIEDIFVMGVMDEIERRALPDQKGASDDTPQVNKISNYFSPTKQPPKKRTEALYLVDSKTRRVDSMPRPSHTVASKTQLMLYKHLFDVHARQTFDWPRFYSHIGTAADEPLSPAFIEQIRAMGADQDYLQHVTTLGDLATDLQAMHADLGVLEEGLELVYRWRSSSSPSSSQTKTKRKRKSTAKKPEAEDVDLQKAIAASLAEQDPTNGASQTASAANLHAEPDSRAKASGSRESPEVLSSDSDLEASAGAPTASASSATPASQPLNTAAIAARAEELVEDRVGSIIGTERFLFNQDKLFTYVKDAIAFWTGRPPRGVSIDEVNKCRSCEFQDGCEWLQQKADEHRANVAARKAQ